MRCRCVYKGKLKIVLRCFISTQEGWWLKLTTEFWRMSWPISNGISCDARWKMKETSTPFMSCVCNVHDATMGWGSSEPGPHDMFNKFSVGAFSVKQTPIALARTAAAVMSPIVWGAPEPSIGFGSIRALSSRIAKNPNHGLNAECLDHCHEEPCVVASNC